MQCFVYIKLIHLDCGIYLPHKDICRQRPYRPEEDPIQGTAEQGVA